MPRNTTAVEPSVRSKRSLPNSENVASKAAKANVVEKADDGEAAQGRHGRATEPRRGRGATVPASSRAGG